MIEITIGIEIVYCCKDTEYEKYIIKKDVSEETLKQLKEFSDNDSDIYFNSPFEKLFENENREFVSEEEFNKCEYKLSCIMC